MKLGLSGGIACGKSTVLACFAKLGFATLSTDGIVAELYRSDSVLLETIRGRFGSGIFDDAGVLNRQTLAEEVFSDEEKLRWLESELHPRVRAYWTASLEAEPELDWLVEIPLLFEKKLEMHFDFTLAVTTHADTQLSRLIAKGWSEEHARKRMSHQMSQEHKAQLADFVLCNDGSLETLHEQVVLLVNQLRLR